MEVNFFHSKDESTLFISPRFKLRNSGNLKVISALFRELMEVQVLSGRKRSYKWFWREKETNSPSLRHCLDKFVRYISNLFLC